MKKLASLLLTALCVFALAACGSSTEWTMMDMKGQESRLSAQDAAAVDRCLKSKDWQDDLRDCIMVRLTDGSGRRIDYWSECNYRISENADISTVCWQSARGIYSKNSK